MSTRANRLIPRHERGPLNVLFMNTSMPVGGAEMLQVQLVRGLDRTAFVPHIICLKEPGTLGEMLSAECPVESNLIHGKYDIPVLGRLRKAMKRWSIDAVITVGAGDKMFWGRLAASSLNVPVILSAIHSTGWPDVIGRLNRMLTRATDAFIGVAEAHRSYLVDQEGFPSDKVVLIPNGVDTERFQFSQQARDEVRRSWGVSSVAPCVGLVAALRSEKNHSSFLRIAKRVITELPAARFVLIGTGPEQERLVREAQELEIDSQVVFAGARNDIPACLSALDAFLLTSQMEASPVSILEALSTQRPVVATNVGSIPESVIHGRTGYLAAVNDDASLAKHVLQLLNDASLRESLGIAGREHVQTHGSLQTMIKGYADLINAVYDAKCANQKFSSRPLSPAICAAPPIWPTLEALQTQGRDFLSENGSLIGQHRTA